MKKLLPLIVAALVLPLAACQHKPETVDNTAPDPQASALANAAPVDLPPAITATKTFRCSDNSLIYVDFFSGGKQVNLRTTEGGDSTTLTSNSEGGPWTSGGDKISGNQSKVTYSNGSKSLTCTA